MKLSFRKRVAILLDSPLIRILRAKKAPKWTGKRRLTVAMANDNKAPWYLCLSTKTVADIERRFTEGSVAKLLYNTVGGILGDHAQLKHSNRKYYLYLQLAMRSEDVDLCLSEIGVYKVVSPMKFSEIKFH